MIDYENKYNELLKENQELKSKLFEVEEVYKLDKVLQSKAFKRAKELIIELEKEKATFNKLVIENTKIKDEYNNLVINLNKEKENLTQNIESLVEYTKKGISQQILKKGGKG